MKFPPRCPRCRSIEFRAVGTQSPLEAALYWILRPFRCGLCGHHFYLFPWRIAPDS